jgi:hypothetical protein
MRNSVTALTFVLTLAVSAAAYAQVDQIKESHDCVGSMPGMNEVFIFTDASFGGTCKALSEGFYPNPSPLMPGSFGLPNDSISSIKVGGAVRARLFQAIVYGGNFVTIGAFSQLATMPSGWNEVVSSIRIESASRSSICDDLRPGEFALFRDSNFTGDCVVLFYTHFYAVPIAMGIANDSVTSVRPGPVFNPPISCGSAPGVPQPAFATLYAAQSNQGSHVTFFSGNAPISFLSTLNDVTSSVDSHHYCF